MNVITSYSIHYTKLYENKANKLEDAFELKNALDNFKELYEKKSDENTHNIVKKLFIRDINSIQVHFKEQIRRILKMICLPMCKLPLKK